MATKIRYNGAEIATVEAGETKVLECSGKKMVSNVAVEMASGALPIEISTEAEMNALLESGEVGGIYKYTGEGRTYENGKLYQLNESEDIFAGTWVFNDNPLQPDTDLSVYCYVLVDFISSNDENYVGIEFSLYADGSFNMGYGKRLEADGYLNGPFGGYNAQKGWQNESDKTIVITSTFAEIVVKSWNKLQFLTWLQANATKQVSKQFTKLKPQLYAPTISLDGDVLTVTPDADNGVFASSYNLYVDDVLMGNYSETRIYLATLGLPTGTYSITATAKGTGFTDSVVSNSVSYEAIDYATELLGTWTLNPSDFDKSMIDSSLNSTVWSITAPLSNGSETMSYTFDYLILNNVGFGYTRGGRGMAFTGEYPIILYLPNESTISNAENNRWAEFSTFTINSVPAIDGTILSKIFAFLQANATKQ